MLDENQLMKIRKQKINELKNLNVNPYAYRYDINNNSVDILNEFKKIKSGSKTKKSVSLAGRIMSLRVMGKVSFGHLQDHYGQIQFYIKEEDLGKNYSIFKKLDIGDIIGIKGIIFKTHKGELSIWVKSFQLLTKNIRPLPEKWHGLKDPELRYRQRYLDLIVNPKVKEVFVKRSQVINSIREFLVKNNYIEVETPILQPIYGGTSARPFESYLNALNMKIYMRISNELYLKRLIVGGYEKVFEFSPDFRNEGIDKLHNPEFLQMETMQAYADYNDNMKVIEELISFVAKKTLNSYNIIYQGKKLTLKKPFQKLSILDAIKKYAKVNLSKVKNIEELRSIAKKLKVEVTNNMSFGEIINAIFEEKVESFLIQPTIIYDYPADTSPLAKPKENDPRFVERFELFINGWEIANVYSELNDPSILRKNFEGQKKKILAGDLEAQPLDEDFIRALEYGMPPTSGIGIGIDRFVMILTDSSSIRDVIFFPFMRPEND